MTADESARPWQVGAIVVPSAEWFGTGAELDEDEKAAWVAQFEPAPMPKVAS